MVKSMSESFDLSLITLVKTVAAAGTREPLATGHTELMRIRTVTIRALSTNGGLVYLGNSETCAAATGYALSAGETLSLSVEADEWAKGISINLKNIYVDAAVNGEGVCIAYVRD